ncbi:hypothetical protein [Kurthia massiliensis]|nr:hypothetical protein [Kurthia massiliensis]
MLWTDGNGPCATTLYDEQIEHSASVGKAINEATMIRIVDTDGVSY